MGGTHHERHRTRDRTEARHDLRWLLGARHRHKRSQRGIEVARLANGVANHHAVRHPRTVARGVEQHGANLVAHEVDAAEQLDPRDISHRAAERGRGGFLGRSTLDGHDAANQVGAIDGQPKRHGGAQGMREHQHRTRVQRIERGSQAVRLGAEGIVGGRWPAREPGAERLDDDRPEPLGREQWHDFPKCERRAEESGKQDDGPTGAGPGLDVQRLRRRDDDVWVLESLHYSVSRRAARDAAVLRSPPSASMLSWKRQSMISRLTTYAARFTRKMTEKTSEYGAQIPKYNANRFTPGSSFERSTTVVSNRTATVASSASFTDTNPPTAKPKKIAISDARSIRVSSRCPASDTRPNSRAMPPSGPSRICPMPMNTRPAARWPVANAIAAARLAQNDDHVT